MLSVKKFSLIFCWGGWWGRSSPKYGPIFKCENNVFVFLLDIGDLKVLYLDDAGFTTTQLTITGDQGDKWRQGQLEMINDKDYQVCHLVSNGVTSFVCVMFVEILKTCLMV